MQRQGASQERKRYRLPEDISIINIINEKRKFGNAIPHAPSFSKRPSLKIREGFTASDREGPSRSPERRNPLTG
jgi:hypothetical protein